MSDMNVGIVGLGWVAGAHIETFKTVQGGNVTAICSRREHDEAALEAEFGTPLKAYTDYEAMIANPDIHIVDHLYPAPISRGSGYRCSRSG